MVTVQFPMKVAAQTRACVARAEWFDFAHHHEPVEWQFLPVPFDREESTGARGAMGERASPARATHMTSLHRGVNGC